MPANATSTAQDRPPFVNTTPRRPRDVNPSGQTSAAAPPHEPYPGSAPIARKGSPADVQQFRRPGSLPRNEEKSP
jgi:hypothetical protein